MPARRRHGQEAAELLRNLQAQRIKTRAKLRKTPISQADADEMKASVQGIANDLYERVWHSNADRRQETMSENTKRELALLCEQETLARDFDSLYPSIGRNLALSNRQPG